MELLLDIALDSTGVHFLVLLMVLSSTSRGSISSKTYYDEQDGNYSKLIENIRISQIKPFSILYLR